MSLYIKGMEMPKDGAFVEVLIWSDGHVTQTGDSYFAEDGRAYYQPCDWKYFSAVPVPEHGRLIDADALMKTCGMATDCYDCPNGEHGWCKRSQDAANICEAIEDAPTIIPADKEEQT